MPKKSEEFNRSWFITGIAVGLAIANLIVMFKS